MAIDIGTSFNIQTNLPIDDRLVLTKAEMLDMNDNIMPSVYLCTCSDDGLLYLYNKNNEVDAETGKFRIMKAEGGALVFTKTEWDALETKPAAGTQVIISDDTAPSGQSNELIEIIYPVGSIYINTTDVNPATILGIGTWERVAQNMSLWGASADGETGTEKTAGLPNITGTLGGSIHVYGYTSTTNGAFSGTPTADSSQGHSAYSGNWMLNPTFSADRGETKLNGTHQNDVYGKSDTVQPPALVVNIWKRTA